MDNEELIKILMTNKERQEIVVKMAASIVAASAVWEKSTDEILNIMNLLVKAEIEQNKELSEELIRLSRNIKKSMGLDPFDDML